MSGRLVLEHVSDPNPGHGDEPWLRLILFLLDFAPKSQAPTTTLPRARLVRSLLWLFAGLANNAPRVDGRVYDEAFCSDLSGIARSAS